MLYEELLNGRISRRDFVKKIGKVSAGAAGMAAFGLSSLSTKPVIAKGKVVVRIGSVWHSSGSCLHRKDHGWADWIDPERRCFQKE